MFSNFNRARGASFALQELDPIKIAGLAANVSCDFRVRHMKSNRCDCSIELNVGDDLPRVGVNEEKLSHLISNEHPLITRRNKGAAERRGT
jgi:hypothetical protein